MNIQRMIKCDGPEDGLEGGREGLICSRDFEGIRSVYHGSGSKWAHIHFSVHDIWEDEKEERKWTL